ncbi:YiiX/YebB-like N1pC/P60 family cysteine hydrolase [Bdellovibrio sp. SKB1291214]|uniref:YiiX/YebB-like N1pC/P60 family cysteine hydrolase n=1 Tax=Bdellovibrio sp. SKB1291214 TaxID=1732569 RepID=UPI000B518856|nr:YiiX/YebB-like N1pC/P60 family cysteine hydrolase [Bdellovibrio sp. SKB1291214]UYL09247.1 YiiX/YebB-like N1pC/P60 family cysteine hydrolase [Bdellovibrio sp. SKB1291214]
MRRWLALATLTISILISALSAEAGTRIAFLETFNSRGERVEYEPGARFSHTAIQFDDIGELWLNAYPGEGVAIITLDQLNHHGTITEVIEIDQPVQFQQAAPYMGLPFDFWYSWDDKAMYCSELLGKLLNIPTHPMTFNKKVWPKNYWDLDGTPGLSPDNLYRWAVEHQVKN